MLYGKHPFYFDDVLYTPREPWVIQPKHFHKFLGGRLGRLKVRPASRGHLGFDRFDYIVMYDWLFAIGKRNRLAIRQLYLRFSHSLFTRRYRETSNDGLPTIIGRDFVAKAFDLIAEAHHLDQIYFSFGDPVDLMLVDNITPRTAGNCHWDTFKHFWYPYNNDHLLPALASIRNIKCLSCAEATENTIGFRKENSRFEKLDTFNDSLKHVKATMESGYVLQTERGLPVSMSGAYIG